MGVWVALRDFFETRGDPEAMPEIACQGCFMLNSMIEFSSTNPEINQRADRYFAMLRHGFLSALERSRDTGTLQSKLDVQQLTEVLLSAALGLNAVIRASLDHTAGRVMAASIAGMVREWNAAT